MDDILHASWHWAFSGLMIVIVMFLLLLLGQRFGVSSSFRTMCNVLGAGRMSDYFKYDWKKDSWLLLFVLGSIIGGYIASHFMGASMPVKISDATVNDLSALEIFTPQTIEQGNGFVPEDLFTMANLLTLKGFILFIIGGFLIGFGTRWAGGCTSGHAISGLSNFQLPSLVAVIGFFIGGLIMTHLFHL